MNTDVRVRPGRRAVELLAHEVEHVLERIEGVSYLIDARHGSSTVLLPDGAFETRRAAGASPTRSVERTEQDGRPQKSTPGRVLSGRDLGTCRT